LSPLSVLAGAAPRPRRSPSSPLSMLAAPRPRRSPSSPISVLAAKTTSARHPRRQASLHSFAPLAPLSSRRSLRSLGYARAAALVAPLCLPPPSLYIRAATDLPPPGHCCR
jgi:hypothetical protein